MNASNHQQSWRYLMLRTYLLCSWESYLVSALQVKQVMSSGRKAVCQRDGRPLPALLCVQAVVGRLFYVCFKMGGTVVKQSVGVPQHKGSPLRVLMFLIQRTWLAHLFVKSLRKPKLPHDQVSVFSCSGRVEQRRSVDKCLKQDASEGCSPGVSPRWQNTNN